MKLLTEYHFNVEGSVRECATDYKERSYLEVAILVLVLGESSAVGCQVVGIYQRVKCKKPTKWCIPKLTHATKSCCVMFSPSKNLWKSTAGAPESCRFHMELEEGSVSLRRDTARLYLAQLAL